MRGVVPSVKIPMMNFLTNLLSLMKMKTFVFATFGGKGSNLGVWTRWSQLHNIYQTNPAFLMRIWLGILCFNTVNQWEIMTQSSCKARGNRIINSKKSVSEIIFNPTCVFIHNLSMTMTWFTYFQIFQQFSKFTCYVSLHTYLWLLVSK